LTGPGGVGKTALAIEVAQCFASTRSASVYFVPLAELNGPLLLMDAVASALGIDCANADPTPQSLINRLAGHTCLIVLDNCEHMIEAVADLVERLMHQCPGLTVLATSREPLRIAHERSVRVPALDVPKVGAERQAILSSASVQLLSMHMRELDGTFAHRHLCPDADSKLDSQSVELMGEICRRLEGMPLALQMAAARACGLGLFELIASLDENLHLLSSGLRTAPARHQTLQASLIWSLRLLDDDELAVLERLSQVQGRLTLDLACDAVQDRQIPRSRVLDCIIGLALKSLLNVTAQGPFRFYAVPDSTRAFIRCALQGTAQIHPDKHDAPVAHRGASALSMATLRTGTSGPIGPDGYHARHQRMLAASR
jgi:predicted ATPase